MENKTIKNALSRKLSFLAFLAALLIGTAFAGDSLGSGSDIGFIKALNSFSNALSGPFAKAIGIAGLVAIGTAMAFGGELGDFVKRLIYVVGAIAVMIGGASLLNWISSQSACVDPSLTADQIRAAGSLMDQNCNCAAGSLIDRIGWAGALIHGGF